MYSRRKHSTSLTINEVKPFAISIVPISICASGEVFANTVKHNDKQKHMRARTHHTEERKKRKQLTRPIYFHFIRGNEIREPNSNKNNKNCNRDQFTVRCESVCYGSERAHASIYSVGALELNPKNWSQRSVREWSCAVGQ